MPIEVEAPEKGISLPCGRLSLPMSLPHEHANALGGGQLPVVVVPVPVEKLEAPVSTWRQRYILDTLRTT